ncbi:MAG: transcriptional repressor [Paludibacteraceae bacterium]|nr:transcriptional repressor [Paludibacteraceae bacterium]
MNTTQEIVSQLQEAGFKPSLQRIAILEYLRTHLTHPTVDEIYEALSPSMPTLSKTTIYNTLRSFSQSGLALSLRLDEKTVHYDGDTAPHAHFICKDCGKIIDVTITNTDMLHIPTLCGADVQAVEISYYGQCNTCKKQK